MSLVFFIYEKNLKCFLITGSQRIRNFSTFIVCLKIEVNMYGKMHFAILSQLELFKKQLKYFKLHHRAY